MHILEDSREGKSTLVVGNPYAPHPLNKSLNRYDSYIQVHVYMYVLNSQSTPPPSRMIFADHSITQFKSQNNFNNLNSTQSYNYHKRTSNTMHYTKKLIITGAVILQGGTCKYTVSVRISKDPTILKIISQGCPINYIQLHT